MTKKKEAGGKTPRWLQLEAELEAASSALSAVQKEYYTRGLLSKELGCNRYHAAERAIEGEITPETLAASASLFRKVREAKEAQDRLGNERDRLQDVVDGLSVKLQALPEVIAQKEKESRKKDRDCAKERAEYDRLEGLREKENTLHWVQRCRDLMAIASSRLEAGKGAWNEDERAAVRHFAYSCPWYGMQHKLADNLAPADRPFTKKDIRACEAPLREIEKEYK